jgi:glycerophosphoryl diester phosphodiesterase
MRRATSSFGIAIAAALLAIAAVPAQAFDLEGHRGTRGLMPENTLAAFSRALAIGVTTLETDIAVTRDGVLVISHDPFLNPDVVRGADGHWLAAKGPSIHSLTLAELQRYDVGRLNPESKYAQQFPQQTAVDGQHFPTLTEVFALARAAPKPVRLNLETKITPTSADETVDAATFAKLLVDAIRGAQMTSRTTIQSFDWRTLVESRRQAPEIETACLTIETPNFDTVQSKSDKPSPWLAGLELAKVDNSLPRLVKAAGCAIWSPFWRNATPALVAEAHALGLKVLPWTVNDPADIAAQIDAGADGIITDYPDRVRTVMSAKGIPLP